VFAGVVWVLIWSAGAGWLARSSGSLREVLLRSRRTRLSRDPVTGSKKLAPSRTPELP
jgi:hypothetical protein